MIVVDASIAVKWFVEEPGRADAIKLLRSTEPLIAPDLVLLEVMNVLRRRHRQSMITDQQVSSAAEVLADYFDRLLPSKQLLISSVFLSRRMDHSVYDCVYLACAIAETASLATADASFAKKVVEAGYANRLLDLKIS